MKINRKKTTQIVLLLSLILLISAGQAVYAENIPAGHHMVTDSRNIEVAVPDDIQRVITIDDGFGLEVMTVFDIPKKLVGVGSRTFEEIDTYEYETVQNETLTYSNGMNTMTYLHPFARTLPVIAEYEAGVNYEALAALNPDIVIIRLGECTFWVDDENVSRAISRIESLDIPVVVLKAPNFYPDPDIKTMYDEIRILGDVFGKEAEAEKLVSFLSDTITTITKRTADIPEEEKPDVLYLGLGYVARDEGGAGNTVSTSSFESWALETIVNAKNAFQEENGYWHVINGEQILSMNPDVIILPTDWGYHPVKELYEAPYFQNLQDLSAIKNHQVTSLPYTPYDCAKRLEYPLELMVIAKAAYPELFSDIDLDEWLISYYTTLYKVDEKTAEGLRSVQWMDWTAEVS
ncbi:MAG: ABC transporter substrate-binding protein [Methanospirillaceae archaeon]|nr:ABC transporter substrate-binding protein [Methanospirillaceae archaeon]